MSEVINECCGRPESECCKRRLDMKWEDTVIEGMQFLKIAHEGGLDTAANAQAEISFKAGKKYGADLCAGYLDPELQVTVSLADMCEKHRKAGRQDVIEWIRSNMETQMGLTRPVHYRIWEAKLKEWEIDGR